MHRWWKIVSGSSTSLERRSQPMKIRDLGVIFCLVFFVCGLLNPAKAIDRESLGEVMRFEIQKKRADQALIEFAKQADRTLLFPFDEARKRTSNSLKGEYRVDVGLEKLLAGTGLYISMGPDGQLNVVDDADLKMTVEGERGMRGKNSRSSNVGLGLAAMLMTTSGVSSAQSDAEQATGDDRATMLDQIVVTAQRREQTLREAPLSVVALPDEQLAAYRITNITDLTDGIVPNLTITPFGGANTTHGFMIRGVNPGGSDQISRDLPTAIYLDGVYFGRAQGLAVDLAELERVEVLRGPQGTLFGRNAIGGAINMTSKKPTGELGFEQQLTLGNMGKRASTSRLNLPEVANLSVKLEFFLSRRDGWVTNPASNVSDWGAMRKRGGRISTLWEPTENVTVEYAYDNSKSEDQEAYFHIHRLIERSGAPPFPDDSFQQLEPNRVSRGRTGAPNQPTEAKAQGHALTATWDLGETLSLKSITSYRELEVSQFNSWAGSFFRPGPAIGNLFGRVSLSDVDQDQFTQEFQLLGTLDRLEFIVGAYYFEEDADDAQGTAFSNELTEDGPQILPDLLFLSNPPDRAARISSRSRALFGQVTWTPPVLADRLDVSVGGRFTSDTKTGSRLFLSGEPAPLPFEFSENRFDPMLTMGYELTDDISTYVRWSTAYRGGGVDTRSFTFTPFEEDEIESWELGLKADGLNGRLRLNAAAFYQEWKNRQITFTIPIGDPPIFSQETLNVSEVTDMYGVEVDLSVIPVAGLTLNLAYGYTNISKQEFENPVTGELLTLREVMPKHTASFSANYEFRPLPFGRLRAFLGGRYVADSFSDPAFSVLAIQPSYTVWDASLRLGSISVGPGGDGNLELALWVQNLTDKEYVEYTFDTLDRAPLINAELRTYGRPRTFGMDLTYRY